MVGSARASLVKARVATTEHDGDAEGHWAQLGGRTVKSQATDYLVRTLLNRELRAAKPGGREGR